PASDVGPASIVTSLATTTRCTASNPSGGPPSVGSLNHATPSSTRPNLIVVSPIVLASSATSKRPTAPGATSAATVETRVGESHDASANGEAASRGMVASFVVPAFHVLPPLFVSSMVPLATSPSCTVSAVGASGKL